MGSALVEKEKTHQATSSKSKPKFEPVGNRHLAVHVPLPLAEVCEELQTGVEHLSGTDVVAGSPARRPHQSSIDCPPHIFTRQGVRNGLHNRPYA